MAKVKKINLPRTRNATHNGVNKEVSAEVKKLPQPNYEMVEELAKDHEDKVLIEAHAMAKLVGSDYTPQIADADAVRFNSCVVISRIVDTGERHYDPEIRKSGKHLRRVLRAFRKLSRKTIRERTVAVTQLTTDMQSPEHRPHVVQLRMLEWVSKLVEQNNAVIALLDNRIHEEGERARISVSDARKATDQAYYKLCILLEALASLSDGAAFRKLIADINLIIDKYNLMIAQSKKHKHDDEDGDDCVDCEAKEEALERAQEHCERCEAADDGKDGK